MYRQGFVAGYKAASRSPVPPRAFSLRPLAVARSTLSHTGVGQTLRSLTSSQWSAHKKRAAFRVIGSLAYSGDSWISLTSVDHPGHFIAANPADGSVRLEKGVQNEAFTNRVSFKLMKALDPVAARKGYFSFELYSPVNMYLVLINGQLQLQAFQNDKAFFRAASFQLATPVTAKNNGERHFVGLNFRESMEINSIAFGTCKLIFCLSSVCSRTELFDSILIIQVVITHLRVLRMTCCPTATWYKCPLTTPQFVQRNQPGSPSVASTRTPCVNPLVVTCTTWPCPYTPPLCAWCARVNVPLTSSRCIASVKSA